MRAAPTTLARWGERRLVRRLQALFPSGRGVTRGIGDDAAVVRSVAPRYDLVLTSDPVIEGVHFAKGTPPARVGRKAVARVLSDLAAMGAEPLWALVDLVAPPALPAASAMAAARGLAKLASRHGLAVVGGDTAEGPRLEFHVFAVGRVPRNRAVLRSGARAGDRLYVTGSLGGSLAGKHLTFEPRLAEGQWLRKGRWASAMMDLSDGLASDLPRLAEESGVGASVRLADLPVSASARRARDGRSAYRHALEDGEDYELLVAVPERKASAFERAWRRTFRLRLTCIGSLTDRAGRIEWVLPSGDRMRHGGGFEHFGRHP